MQKYNHITLSIPRLWWPLVNKECHQIGQSKQDFFRSLVVRHFLDKHGVDINLNIEKLLNEKS